ncbi:MAG: hypothetical protein WDN75_10635 [Bacteroidota bacterium]
MKKVLLAISALCFLGITSIKGQSLYDSFDDCSPWTGWTETEVYPSTTTSQSFCANSYSSLPSVISLNFDAARVTSYFQRDYSFKAGKKYVITVHYHFYGTEPGRLTLTPSNSGSLDPVSSNNLQEANFVYIANTNSSTIKFSWRGTSPSNVRFNSNIYLEDMTITEDPCEGTSASISGPSTLCYSPYVTLTASTGKTSIWNSNGGGWSYSSQGQSKTVLPGTSEVYVLDNSYCLQYAAKYVGPDPGDPTISASGSTTFCPGNSVTLTATSGASYRWVNSQGQTVGTSQTLTVSNSANYSVWVTSQVDANAIVVKLIFLFYPLHQHPFILYLTYN